MNLTRRLCAAGSLLTALSLLACNDSTPIPTGTVGASGSPPSAGGSAGAAGTAGAAGAAGAGGKSGGGTAPTPPCWPSWMGVPSSWDTQFTVAGVVGDDYAPIVRDMAPDGQGGLLVAGYFYAAGKWPARGLASWKDGQLQPLALPPGSPAAPAGGFHAVAVSAKGVRAFAPFFDLTTNQGAIWVQQGEEVKEVGRYQGQVRRLTWIGDTLWAAGSFTFENDGPKYLATWDGAWHGAAGGDPDGPIFDVVDDTGGAVLIGGQFSSVGKVTSPGVARWTGTAWSSEFAMPDQGALVLTLARDKAGRLHAGGRLGVSDATASDLRRHDGASWVTIGSVITTPTPFVPYLPTVGVSQIVADGDGLIVSGSFDHVKSAQGAPDSLAAAGIARWDGTTWQSIDGGAKPVGTSWYDYGCSITGLDQNCVWSLPQQRLVKHDGAVFVGGSFGGLGGVASQNITSYRDGAWKPVGETGSGFTGFLSQVRAVGPTTEVYGLTNATHAGGLPLSSRVVRFEESTTYGGTGQWLPVGPALPPGVTYCDGFAVDPTSKVPWLICNGTSNDEVGRLYRLTDGAWQPVAHELTWVKSLDFAPDGSLYVVGGSYAGFVARIDGDQPVMMGPFDDDVVTLAFAPRAGGYDLIVGGDFTLVDGKLINHIARWDGTTWSALGQGSNAPVVAVAATPDFVYLASAAQSLTDRLVLGRWDGTTWTELGDEAHGLLKPLDAYSMHAFRSIQPLGDGFVATGYVRPATGGSDVFRFSGEHFYALNSGSINNSFYSAAVTCSGLWLAGVINTVGDSVNPTPSVGVARIGWQIPPFD